MTDVRRIPYNINHDTAITEMFDEMERQFKLESIPYKMSIYWHRYIVNKIWLYIKPRSLWWSLKCRFQRLFHGYSDNDLNNYSFYAIDVAIAAIHHIIKLKMSYPAEYADDDIVSDGPNKGRGWDGYQVDLETILCGFEHQKEALSLNEQCTCCEDYCNDMECPIIKEAWTLYIDSFSSLWT